MSLLRENQDYRDCDFKLIARIWFDQAGADEKGKSVLRQSTAYDFLIAFREKQYISPESIRRCRQKLQEKHEELRGLSYKSRKKKGEEMKKEIHSV